MFPQTNVFDSDGKGFKRFNIRELGGMNRRGVDGSVYNPRNEQDQSGLGGNLTSEGVNDDVNLKLAVVPSKIAPGWCESFPLGAFLFGSVLPYVQEQRQETVRNRTRFVKPMDCMEMFLPEQISYIIHEDYVRAVRQAVETKGKTEIPTLQDYFNRFRTLGTNVRLPSNQETKPLNARRLGEERVINFRPISSRGMVDYWGRDATGSGKCYVYFMMKMVPVKSDESVYLLDTHNADMKVVSNRLGENTTDRITHVPKLVAVASDEERRPGLDQLLFKWKKPIVHEDGSVVWVPKRSRGYFVRVGRVIRNFNTSTNHSTNQIQEMSNVRIPVSWKMIDVHEFVDDGLLSDNYH